MACLAAQRAGECEGQFDVMEIAESLTVVVYTFTIEHPFGEYIERDRRLGTTADPYLSRSTLL